VRFSGSPALRAAATYSIAAGPGTIGSGVAVIPASGALKVKGSRRFPGLDDTAATSLAAPRQLTFRSNLMLIETAGEPASVRVMLRYPFPGGVANDNGGTAREFPLAANQFLLIEDVVRAVIGEQREVFGDLRNAYLDVAVLSGAGAVIPILQVVDLVTGDVTIRHQ
jgi:hypothetical protein